MRFFILLITLGFAMPTAAAQWDIVKSESSIGFTAEQAGDAFSGTFSDYNATITYDSAKLAETAIDVTVNVASVRVEGDDRQEEITGAEWFDVAQFATARFVAAGLEQTAGNMFLANGTLTIRGVSKPTSVTFTLTPEAEKLRAIGAFTINRRDFNVGTGDWEEDTWVPFPVEVTFNLLTATK